MYILTDDLSPLNVALFKNRSYFGKKASGTSAVTAVIYAGNAQSLNGLAFDLLALGTLYLFCFFSFLFFKWAPQIKYKDIA